MRPSASSQLSSEEHAYDDELLSILEAMRAYDTKQRREEPLRRGTTPYSCPPQTGHILPSLERAASTPSRPCPLPHLPETRRASSECFASRATTSHPRGVYRQPLCRSYFLNKSVDDESSLKAMVLMEDIGPVTDVSNPVSVATSNDTSDDEALARRLQLEWNQESGVDHSMPSFPVEEVPRVVNGINHFDEVTRSCGVTFSVSNALHTSHEMSESNAGLFNPDDVTGPFNQDDVHHQLEQQKLAYLKSVTTSSRADEWNDESTTGYSTNDDDWSCGSNDSRTTLPCPTVALDSAVHEDDHTVHEGDHADHERDHFLHQGLLETAKSILFGQFATVTCQGCREQLRLPLDYSLVYCQGCGVVSPTGGTAAPCAP